MKTAATLIAVLLGCMSCPAYIMRDWGGAGFQPVPGDYDGDGTADFCVYHRDSGGWYALSAQSNVLAWAFLWGGRGAAPAAGDFDGDGSSDFAVYFEASGKWYAYSPAQTSVVTWAFAWGGIGSIPVAADYDGDGVSDMAVYNEQGGQWWAWPSTESATATAGDTNAFRAALESAGFIVAQGTVTNVDVIGLFNAGITPSCYGNNADTPYCAIKLPNAPGQTVSNTLPWTFRLNPDEAIVLVGRTPPDVLYYSYRSYLALRYFPASGARSRVFGSMGDAINNFTIRTSGTPNGNPGNAYEKDTIVIFTPDRGIDARIRAAAGSAGFSDSLINTDIIPVTLARLGMGADADELTVLHRTTYFADTNAGAQYMADMSSAIQLWRVTPVSSPAPDPFPMPELRVRGTGTTEYDLNDTLEELRDAILAAHAGMDATQLVTSVFITDGFDGIQRGADVLGDCRDTVYLATEDFCMSNGEFAVVYGVNHQASGKAIYANVNVYGRTPTTGNDNEFAGVASVGTRDNLPGTARTYLGDHPQADLFYAYRVARDNPGGATNCLVIPAPHGRLRLDVLCLAFRAYIEPGRKVGPCAGEMLYDRAILFRSRPKESAR